MQERFRVKIMIGTYRLMQERHNFIALVVEFYLFLHVTINLFPADLL